MTQQVKEHDIMPDKLNSIPGSHMVEGKKQPLKVVSDPSYACYSNICMHICAHTHTHTLTKHN